MKTYLIAATLALLVGSPALADTPSQHSRSKVKAEGSYAFVPADPTVVVVDGKIIGRDPDAFIRQSLLRGGDPAQLAGH